MDSAMQIWPAQCNFGSNKSRFGNSRCRLASGMASITHICNKELASANSYLASAMPIWPQQCRSSLSNASLASAAQLWPQQCNSGLSNAKMESANLDLASTSAYLGGDGHMDGRTGRTDFPVFYRTLSPPVPSGAAAQKWHC